MPSAVPAGRGHDAEHADVNGQTMRLFQQIEHEPRDTRRRRLRDQVILLNVGLARGVAARYRHRGMEAADLEQVAYVGLVKAARGFCLDAGCSFPAYARPTISGEIKRHFRDHGWMVRPPRHLQEVHAELRRCEAALGQRLGRGPTPAEVFRASHLSAADQQAVSALDSAYQCASLDAPTGDGAGCVGDRVPSREDPFAVLESRLVLAGLLDDLSSSERELLRLRFGEELSQREIGEILGMSQMQVSRLLSRVIGRLREQVA